MDVSEYRNMNPVSSSNGLSQ